MPHRFESFHRTLARSGRLVGVLRAVVQVLRPAMLHRVQDLAVRHLVAGELVGDDHPGRLPQALEELAEELLGGHRVSARLHEHVEHVAVLIHRPPQLPLFAVYTDQHLVHVPFIAGSRPAPTQLVGVLLPEPVTPGPDRLVGDVDTAFDHQLLHVAEAEREPVLQPDAMADHLGREPQPFVQRACTGHNLDPPGPPSGLVNLM